MINIKNLTKTYMSKNGIGVKALNDVFFDLPGCGLIFIAGKSGCGKSTLLNLLGGMDTPDSGSITAFGKKTESLKERELDEYRNEDIGFIFQEYHLIEHLTAKENVVLAKSLQRKKAGDKQINELFARLDIAGQEDKLIDELSGGQKQRIAIARALIKNPRIILADEPTGALDSVTGAALFKTLKEISKEKLVIVVSHDISSAEEFGDRIIELSDGIIISDRARTGNGFVDISKLQTAVATDKVKAINKSAETDKMVADFKISGAGGDEKNKAVSEALSAKSKQKSKLGLPIIEAFKLGFKGMFKHYFRLIAAALTAVIALTALGLFTSFITYDREKVFINSMYDTGNYYLPLSKTKGIIDGDLAGIEATLPGHKLNKNYAMNSIVTGYNKMDNYARETTDPLISLGAENYNSLEMDEEISKSLKFNKLAGEYPKSDNEVMISEYTFLCFKELGHKDYTTGQITEINSHADLIGKKIITINNWGREVSGEFTVCGILDTNFELKWYKTPTSQQMKKENYLGDLMHRLENYFTGRLERIFFFNNGFYERFINKYNLEGAKIFTSSEIAKAPRISNVQPDGYVGNYSMSAVSKLNGFPYRKLDPAAPDFTDDFPNGIVWKNNTPKTSLAEGEIIIPFSDLTSLTINREKYVFTMLEEKIREIVYDFAAQNFNAVKSAMAEDYINPTTTDYYNYILSQTKEEDNIYQSGKMYDYFKNLAQREVARLCINGLIEEREFSVQYVDYDNPPVYTNRANIVGVYFTEESDQYKFYNTVFIADKVFDDLCQTYSCYTNYNLYTVLTGNYKKDYALVKSLAPMWMSNYYELAGEAAENGLGYRNGTLDGILDSEDALKTISMISGIVSAVIAVFAFIIIFNYFSASIVDDGKKIGILRAMGAKKSDIFSIYYIRSLLIAIGCAVLSVIGIAVGVPAINNMLYAKFNLIFSVLSFSIIPVLSILALSIVSVTLASVIPIIKIASKSPVKSIRSL